MPRDAKHQQEKIWTNSRVNLHHLHHVQGLLPLPLPFTETMARRWPKWSTIVCLSKIPHSVFGSLLENEDWMTYTEDMLDS